MVTHIRDQERDPRHKLARPLDNRRAAVGEHALCQHSPSHAASAPGHAAAALRQPPAGALGEGRRLASAALAAGGSASTRALTPTSLHAGRPHGGSRLLRAVHGRAQNPRAIQARTRLTRERAAIASGDNRPGRRLPASDLFDIAEQVLTTPSGDRHPSPTATPFSGLTADMEPDVKGLRAVALSSAGVGWRASRGSDGGSD
jgi:hypothetical protein